jgi:3-methyl-2-oxobutanoate hydroxymethyltransferase
MQEANAEAVKIEGAGPRLASIETVASQDIPVWAHLGLTPQSVHGFGGHRVQGKESESARRILEQARRVESAGACAIVLECIPHQLAGEITKALAIPTIGIGAGPECDGQVLVFHDLLGFDKSFVPRFVKQYAQMEEAIPEALRRYVSEVRDGSFPTLEQSYTSAKELAKKARRR